MNENKKTKQISFIDGGVCAPRGFLANGVHCGLRKNKSKLDLALIYSKEPCAAAAVYTQNLVFGAPIAVTKESLEDNKAQAVVCNSGVANTCSPDGMEKALAMREITAEALGIKAEDVIVASTGVIGKSLDLEPIQKAMPALAKGLSNKGSAKAAEAIMTTDTRKKEYAVEFEIEGKVCRIGAVSKGSGMICPNMATMLSFITTDVLIDDTALKSALKAAVENSFNMLSIDGDTSTNDMVSIMANGLAGNPMISQAGEAYEIFQSALKAICIKLAREMARDGEGATKLIECVIRGAKDENTAKILARSVINSALVKTAMFGEDANWGRIICAMGYAGVDLDVNRVDIAFSSAAGRVQVCQNGAALDFSEDKAAAVLAEDEIIIEADLADGDGNARAFGCDLSYDYVKINGDYRT
ncbi:MAG: bifunctional ornithine acetyltransferase/N-acetylglutamate synthase [Clostridiales bacterium]|nr:bifunctional ornithine acetyltransferase/N-acetylglutamate synthase [Clostridiales bacterium]